MRLPLALRRKPRSSLSGRDWIPSISALRGKADTTCKRRHVRLLTQLRHWPFLMLRQRSSPYQCARLSRYDASPELGRGHETARVHWEFSAARLPHGHASALPRFPPNAHSSASWPVRTSAAGARYSGILMQRLQDLGYVEGRNIDIVYFHADGDMARLPALAAELVRARPDVVVATNNQAVIAMKQATNVIPIVGTVLHRSDEPRSGGKPCSAGGKRHWNDAWCGHPCGKAVRTCSRNSQG